MKRPIIFILTAIVAAALFGCSDGPDAPENSNNVTAANRPVNPDTRANDLVEELGMIVKLPYEPTEAFWREDAAASGTDGQPAPNVKRLKATLRFDAEDIQKLMADLAASNAQPEPVVIDIEQWFPAELITKSEMGEESKLNGTSYPADIFYQARYLSGRAVRIDETDYFVLELYSK